MWKGNNNTKRETITKIIAWPADADNFYKSNSA